MWHDVEHCVALSSGFWALVLTAQALVGPEPREGTEVVLPSLTYRRLADAMNWAGLTPHFLDISEDDLSLDASRVREVPARNIALILGVNPIAGTLDPEPLTAVATEFGVPLLIDSVEAQADTYRSGLRVGGAGNAEIFSCHASKLINGGEGGYVTTNDSALADQLRLSRNFGKSDRGDFVAAGFNAKMSEMQAAWILASLEGVQPQLAYYEAIFELYSWYLRDVPELTLRSKVGQTSFKNIVVETKEEVAHSAHSLVQFLNANGAQARQYYAPPLHERHADYLTVTGPMAVTSRLSTRLLLLPSGSRLSADHVARIARLCRRFYDQRLRAQ